MDTEKMFEDIANTQLAIIYDLQDKNATLRDAGKYFTDALGKLCIDRVPCPFCNEVGFHDQWCPNTVIQAALDAAQE